MAHSLKRHLKSCTFRCLASHLTKYIPTIILNMRKTLDRQIDTLNDVMLLVLWIDEKSVWVDGSESVYDVCAGKWIQLSIIKFHWLLSIVCPALQIANYFQI